MWLGNLANLGGGLGKKEGSSVFEEGVILQCTLCTIGHLALAGGQNIK